MFQGSWVSKLYFLNNPLILRVNQLYLSSGYEVTQLVGALRYKAEARGFDSWWRDWDFLFTSSFRPHYDPGIDSVSDRKAPRILCTSKILEPNKRVHADIVQKSSKFSTCLCFSLFFKKINPYIESFLRMSYFTTRVAICIRKLQALETVRSFVQLLQVYIFIVYIYVTLYHQSFNVCFFVDTKYDTLRAGSGCSILILLANCQQTRMTYTIAVCTVKNSWWWTEELSETRRVSFPRINLRN